ncbi:hypothetical protein GEMRC1_009988 [Eukaryota sp. GEM-RC1]
MEKADLNVVKFLSFLMEFSNDGKLDSKFYCFVAKTSLDFCSSRDEEVRIGNQHYSHGMNSFYGNTVSQSYEKAFTLFNEGANHNHVDSLFSLGSCYYLGLGVEKNLSKAVEYFKKIC